MTTLKIGGPLAIRCPVCDAAPRDSCARRDGRCFLAKPHAARAALAQEGRAA